MPLPSPFTVIPDERLLCAQTAAPTRPGFAGRCGVLITRDNGIEQTHYAWLEAPQKWFCRDYRQLCRDDIEHPLSQQDVPVLFLTNGLGKTISLGEFFIEFFSGMADRPYFQGGRELEYRKGLFRDAMLQSMRMPCVRLLQALNSGQIRGEPIGLAEWWIGPSPAHAIRFDGAFYPPVSAARSLLNWLLEGIDHLPPTQIADPEHAPDIPVLYEDNDIVAVNKPPRLASVPGIRESISAQSLLEQRFGPLLVTHRLDADTSGILLFARNMNALNGLNQAFRNRDAHKVYKARLETFATKLPNTVTLPLCPNPTDRPRQCVLTPECGGKASITRVEHIGEQHLSGGRVRTLVHLYPETGRTHQLRMHCAHAMGIGIPIDGDPFYGTRALANESQQFRLCLHAEQLRFEHPITGNWIDLECPVDFPDFD